MPIDTAELDRLQQTYKAAVDEWVAAIREEEALASSDYSLPAWERWDQAGFKEQDAQDKAKSAKEAYKEGLRQRDYGF
jgi:flagellar biosynthesis/type III secretory pathway protein FliH